MFNSCRESEHRSAAVVLIGRFEQIGGKEVEVRGWPQLLESEQEKWIEKFSDHALLYFEVSKAH